MVSVVLPVRHVNRAWLKRSMESVLGQDYPNKELIVVNDEATEDIDSLVKSYGIKKYIKNARNLKLPHSLNRGFELAEGALHTWTSADNYMLPGMLATLSEELFRNPDVGIVFGRSVTVDEHGAVTDTSIDLQKRMSSLAGIDPVATTMPGHYTCFGSLGACFMYRAEVWRKMRGYDETIHGAEDYDFWIRASSAYAIRRLPVEMPAYYAYRVHPSSMSSQVQGCYTRMRLAIVIREWKKRPADFWVCKALCRYLRICSIEWLRNSVRRTGKNRHEGR
jgi:glycosyltransferase involved in cell wall biosynthesis